MQLKRHCAFYRICLIACLHLSQLSFPQSLSLYRYSVEDGLPSSETYHIMQDSRGFIWISTDRGVCRFDGYKFHLFTTENGLTDNTVFESFEDELGRIWFITYNGRLCFYEHGTIRAYSYNNLIDSKIGKLRMHNSFYADSKGNVYIGYVHEGLVKITASGKFMRIGAQEYGDTVLFSVDRADNKLLTSSMRNKKGSGLSGVYRLHYEGVKRTVLFSGASRMKTFALWRKNKSLFIYIPGQYLEVNNSEKEKVILTADEPLSVFEDTDSCLWISTISGGVRKYEPDKGVGPDNFSEYLPGGVGTGIFQDKEGGFWFSTLNSGIMYSPTSRVQVIHFDPGKESDAGAVCIDRDGTAWVGFSGGQVARIINGKIKESYPVAFDKDSFYYFTSTYYDERCGKLWATYLGGISLQPFRPFRAGYASNIFTNSLMEGNNGNILRGANFSLHSHDSEHPEKTEMLVSTTLRTNCWHRAKDGTVWAGTMEGLYKLEQHELQPFLYNNAMLRSRIQGIRELSDGTLVLGTIGNGILLLKENKVKRIHTASGLASDLINSLDVNNNIIWAGTGNGLSRIELRGDSFLIRNYNVSHGLPTNEIRQVRASDKLVLLGTRKGAVTFNPADIPLNITPPGIYITWLGAGSNLLGKSREKITLSYQEIPVRIDFVGFCFRKMGKIRYRYRLGGLKDEWLYTSNPSVQFITLDPGEYRFEVQAENEDGTWSTKAASIDFSIQPPVWKTWWFISLFSLWCVLVTWRILAARMKRVRQKNLMLGQIASYRQQAMSAQMNPHFIFNSLNSIQAYILTEDKKNATKYLAKFSRLMRFILDNSRQDYITLADELQALELYIELEVLRFKNKFTYKISVPDTINPFEIQVPSLLIQPYAENAIRHGLVPLEGSEGRLSVTITMENRQLFCTVEDNGIGREAAAWLKKTDMSHRPAGTSITAQRLELLCKNTGQRFFLETTDGPVSGTIVKFAIPSREYRGK